MSVFSAERLLEDMLKSQIHTLARYEHYYTGRPIYEKPVSFNTERGELSTGETKGQGITFSKKKKAEDSDDISYTHRNPAYGVVAELEPVDVEVEAVGIPEVVIKRVSNRKTSKADALKKAASQRSIRNVFSPTKSRVSISKIPKRGKGSSVKMSKKDYMSEHHSLIKMLNDISSKTKKEAEKQSKEVKGKVGKGKHSTLAQDVMRLNFSRKGKKNIEDVLREANRTGNAAKVAQILPHYQALEEELPKAEKELRKKVQSGTGKKCVNNIKGGCGDCGGTNGTIVLKKGGNRDHKKRKEMLMAPTRELQAARLERRKQIDAAFEELEKKNLPINTIVNVLLMTYPENEVRMYLISEGIPANFD
jgi:hypothetical protein